jgi:hypothetical protein
MSKIRVDIDELSDKLNEMKEDDYVTAELEIVFDDYSSELKLSAVSFEDEEPIEYGTICEADDELL